MATNKYQLLFSMTNPHSHTKKKKTLLHLDYIYYFIIPITKATSNLPQQTHDTLHTVMSDYFKLLLSKLKIAKQLNTHPF